MTNESNDNKGGGSGQPDKGGNVGPRGVLNYLKDNKNSKISAFIGKASDIYAEIGKFHQSAEAEASSRCKIAPDSVVKDGALSKAVEIAKLEWVKSKLETEDPVECAEKYSNRMARINGEYLLKNILFANVSIIGYMRDRDTKADWLLVHKPEPGKDNQVWAIDPVSGDIVEKFDAAFCQCLLTLKRAD